MRCDECLTLLDQYVEGEFDEQTAEPLAAHVTDCAGCSRAHESLRHEQELYASYLLDVEASPALWSSLNARIAKEKGSNKLRPLTELKRWVTSALSAQHFTFARTAALLVITAGMTVGVVRYIKSGKGDHGRKAEVNGIALVQPTPESRLAELVGTRRTGERGADIKTKGDNNSAPGRREVRDRPHKTTFTAGGSYPRRERQMTITIDYQPLPDDVLRKAERQYLTDINFLSRVANGRGRQFSPTALAKLRKTLAVIDQTIAETRHYVSQHPSDPVAVQQMMNAYSRKVEVLREMANT